MRRWPLALARWQEAGSGFRGSQATLRRGPGPRGSGSRQAHRGRVPRAVGQDGPRRQRPRSVRECEALRKPFLRPGALVPSYARYARASCGSWLVARGSWLVARGAGARAADAAQVSSLKCQVRGLAEGRGRRRGRRRALCIVSSGGGGRGVGRRSRVQLLGSRFSEDSDADVALAALDEGARWRGQLSG